MKSAKKLAVWFLSLTLCLVCFVVPVCAETLTQDGIEVTLTTDKDSYAQGEKIAVTVTATNTNDTAVSNVSIENLIPDGFQLADGTSATANAVTLEAGETLELNCVYEAAASGGDTSSGASSSDDTSSEPNTDNSSDASTGTSSINSDNGTSNTSTGVAKTGDNSNMVWLAIVVLASAAVLVVLCIKKKKQKNALSLMLCVAMMGTMGTGLSMKKVNAETVAKTLSLSENVQIAGQTYLLETKVSYEMVGAEPEVPSDAGEISFTEPDDSHIIYDEEEDIYHVDNQILLTANENVTKEQVAQLVRPYQGTIVGYIEITNDFQIEFMGITSVEQLREIASALQGSDLIVEAYVHDLFETDTNAIPNDAEWKDCEWSAEYPQDDNWGVEAINAMGAWDYIDQMQTVKVGVLDTVFDINHEDLQFTKVWNNPTSINGNDSHGTHVSGTIAAKYNNDCGISGVAPKVDLYAYAIFGNETQTKYEHLIGFMEIKYALANLITSNCKVLNVSMSEDALLDEQAKVFGTFLSKLLDKGYDFVIVQAAGNAGTENPATDATASGLFTGITIEQLKDRIIVVGALSHLGSYYNDTLDGIQERIFRGYWYADFSFFGDRVDITAPGVNIYSTIPDNKYGGKEGTSMAAPHISGIAAMCFSVNPTLTGKQVKSIITNSATTQVTDNNTGHPVKTYGVANAKAAVELAMQTSGETITPVNPSNGIVMGNVREVSSDGLTGLGDSSICAYRISDYDGNLSEYYASTQTDYAGNYELILEAGQYYINIYHDGYLPFAFYDVTVTNDEITYLDNAVLTEDSGAATSASIAGYVRNALSGEAVDGVQVQLRTGWQNYTTEYVSGSDGQRVTAYTDMNGRYSLNVREGTYTAEFSKDGYITGYANIICSHDYSQDQDAVLTPVLSDDEYRIVLTWSSTPSDLDSHISGPLSTGDRFHVFYANMSAQDNGETVAMLDLDDTTSYGPETITLKKTQDGVYKYSVHDFSNKESDSSKELSMSGAKVEVYRGNTRIATFNAPINQVGTVWNVFELEGDTLRTINTMENISSPDAVCAISNEIATASVLNETENKIIEKRSLLKKAG